MKMNNLTFTSMKKSIKYICLFLMLMGINTGVWAGVIDKTNYTISTDAIDFGDLDASDDDYQSAGYIETYQEITITLKTARTTYAYFWASPDEYYITGYQESSQNYVGSAVGSYTLRVYTLFPLTDATYTSTLVIYIGAESEEIEVTGTVINGCTTKAITLSGSPAGTLTHGTISANKSAACEGATVSLSNSPATGYILNSWDVYQTGTPATKVSVSNDAFTMPSYAVTVNATFNARKYDVTLNPNGGSGSNQTVEATYDAAMPLVIKTAGTAIVVPTKTGYNLGGFYDTDASSGGTKYYDYSGSLSSANNWDKANHTTVLYARWSPNVTTITLDKNGGSSNGTASVKYDATAVESISHASTSATGYHLEGYYTDDVSPVKVLNDDGTFAGSTVSGYVTSSKWSNTSSAITLKAHWALDVYTIVYKDQGGGSFSGTHGDGYPTTHTYNSATALVNPTKTGYTFGGWYPDEDCEEDAITSLGATAYTSGPITLYAKWTAESIALTLDDNGGTSDGSGSVTFDGTSATISSAPVYGTKLISGYYTNDATPVKVLEANGSFAATNVEGYIVGGKWKKATATTLYAHWVTDNKVVTFNLHGHGGDNFTQNVESGTNAIRPMDPTDIDYNFDDWYTDEAGEPTNTKFDFANTTITAATTIHAKWTKKTYQRYIFACVDLSVASADAGKALVTSRNGVEVMATNPIKVTVEGVLDGHAVNISSTEGLKFYKKVDGVYKDLSVAANMLRGSMDGQEVYVSYAPTTTGTGAITAPTFTISCDGESQTFNTSGEYVKVRNLPDAVAIVAKVGNTYHALTGNITSSTTPEDIMISASTVEGILKANGPADLAYKLWPVKTTTGSADRFGTGSGTTTAFGDRIRLAGKSDKGLMANNNASSNKYNINNSATIDEITDDPAAPYEWKVTTTEVDGQFVYTLQTDQTNNDRKLRMYNGRWGTYLDGKGVEELYMLPLVTTAQADMEAYEWGLNELVVKYSPAATPVALTSIKAAATEITASETTKITRIGSSDLWKIQGLSGLSMGSKPAEQLIISVTENGAAKQALIQIPFLVSDAKTDQDLRLSVSNVAKVYQNTDVVILQTGKLTNQYAAGVFNDLYIYPGGKLIADANKMTVSRLYMRGGYSYIGSPRWNVPRAKIGAGLVMDVDTIIYDLNMNAEQYYDLAVPYAVKLEEATDDEGYEDFNVWLQIYDGNNRANNGKGWTWFNWAVATPTLQPGVGYLIEAEPRYNRTYCTVRFPMKADLSEGEGDKTPVAVTAHGLIDGNIMNGKTPNNVGWNFCANPYLCDFGIGEDAEHFEESPDGVLQIGELALGEDGKYKWDTEGAKNVRYVTTFDFESQHYEQYPLEDVTLAPFTGFFIQVGKTGTLNFANEGRQLSAPALRNNSMPRDMEIAIQLTGNGQADEARLHINDDLTISDPLEFPDENTKQINANYVNLYSYSDSVSMYANGLSYDESENWNDMGVVAPSDGEYTFSIKKVNRNYVNGVLILDKTTSVAYNLLDGDVTLQLPAGTINGRFAVKIQYGPAVTTGIDENGDALQASPEKFIYEDKMFIRCKGVLYDATGKKVGEVRKAQ